MAGILREKGLNGKRMREWLTEAPEKTHREARND